MSAEHFDFRNVDFREIFPWIHLFRGFRIAFWKSFLGAAGVLLMSIGWWAIVSLPWLQGEKPVEPPPLEVVEGEERQQAEKDRQREFQKYAIDLQNYQSMKNVLEEIERLPWKAPLSGKIDVYRSVRMDDWPFDKVPSSFWMVLEPVRCMSLPVRLMFQSTQSALTGFLLTVWTLLVWALFGGVITRIAAVQVAREGYVTVKESFGFVLARYTSYLLAPVLPFLGVVVIGLLCALGGLFTWIPGIDVAMGLVWFLALLAGFVMAITLVGLAFGWPLMYSAIGAEATESFDALSRSFSYVLYKPWNFLFYVVVAILYGGILTTLVATFGYLMIKFSHYAVSWGIFWEGGEANLRAFYAYVPEAGGWRSTFGLPEGSPGGTQALTAYLVCFWTHLVFLGMVGFAYSYFWSSMTIIYFLLRKDVDETEFEEVYLQEEEEEPFPTASPTAGSLSPEPPPSSSAEGSLPIVDPPPPQE